MIHHSLFAIVLVLLLSSCNHPCRVVRDTYLNKKEKEVFIYRDCPDTTYYIRQVYHPNGQLAEEGTFIDGHMQGLFRTWALNGTQTGNWNAIDGLPDGLVQHWYDNGNKKEEIMYDHGDMDGLSKTWYENGKQQSESHYVNDGIYGSYTFWMNDSNWILNTYENSVLSGPFYQCWTDSTGFKSVTGQFENGEKTGKWDWWGKDSILITSEVFTNDKPNRVQ